jgi:segregation and condensation protein A
MAQRSPRSIYSLPEAEIPGVEELLVRVSLYDLAKAYEEVRRRLEEQTVHQVSLFKVTLEERMAWVLEQLQEKSHFSFLTVLRLESVRLLWVISFLAVLELARRREICLEQGLPFADLWVCLPQKSTLEAA